MDSKRIIELVVHSIDEHEYSIINWDDYRIGYFLKKNMGKSVNNEDALFVYGESDSLVIGVADGAGGHPRGKDAAFIAVSEVVNQLKNKKKSELQTIELIEDINDKILDLKVGARSTLAMTTIKDGQARSFSVGDSEVLYWNSNGALLYSNIPDTNIGHRIEAGMIEQKDSLEVSERHIVNNLLGDANIRTEVASKMEVKKGHTLLIGSDGLFDNISHDSLSDVVARGVFEKSFEDLVERCIKQEENHWIKDDDISFVMVRRIKAKE